MAKRRLSFRILVGVLIVWAAAFGVWRLIHAPREAKARLADLRHVLAMVAQYAREHQGAWPQSWEEIEKTNPPEDAPPRQGTWPEVRNHVKVNFQVDPKALVKAGPEQFSAIAPKGSCGDYRADVERLLLAIQEGLQSAGVSTPKPAPVASETAAKVSTPPGKPSSLIPSSSKEPSKSSSQEKVAPPATGPEKAAPAKIAPPPSEIEKPKEEKSPNKTSPQPASDAPKRIILPGLE